MQVKIGQFEDELKRLQEEEKILRDRLNNVRSPLKNRPDLPMNDGNFKNKDFEIMKLRNKFGYQEKVIEQNEEQKRIKLPPLQQKEQIVHSVPRIAQKDSQESFDAVQRIIDRQNQQLHDLETEHQNKLRLLNEQQEEEAKKLKELQEKEKQEFLKKQQELQDQQALFLQRHQKLRDEEAAKDAAALKKAEQEAAELERQRIALLKKAEAEIEAQQARERAEAIERARQSRLEEERIKKELEEQQRLLEEEMRRKQEQEKLEFQKQLKDALQRQAEAEKLRKQQQEEAERLRKAQEEEKRKLEKEMAAAAQRQKEEEEAAAAERRRLARLEAEAIEAARREAEAEEQKRRFLEAQKIKEDKIKKITEKFDTEKHNQLNKITQNIQLIKHVEEVEKEKGNQRLGFVQKIININEQWKADLEKINILESDRGDTQKITELIKQLLAIQAKHQAAIKKVDIFLIQKQK